MAWSSTAGGGADPSSSNFKVTKSTMRDQKGKELTLTAPHPKAFASMGLDEDHRITARSVQEKPRGQGKRPCPCAAVQLWRHSVGGFYPFSNGEHGERKKCKMNFHFLKKIKFENNFIWNHGVTRIGAYMKEGRAPRTPGFLGPASEPGVSPFCAGFFPLLWHPSSLFPWVASLSSF